MKSAAQLARSLGVTERTIRNYVRAGLPRRPDGTYSPAAARAWLEDNAPGTRGGVREGAGRRGKFPRPPRPARAQRPKPSAGRPRTAPPPPTDPDALLAWVRDHGATVTPRQVQTIAQAARAASELHRLRVRERAVLPVDEVREAIAAHLAALRRALEGMPPALASTLAAELSLAPSQAAAVRKAATTALRDAFARVAGDPLDECST